MGKKVKAAPTKKWNELQTRLNQLPNTTPNPEYRVQSLKTIAANVNISWIYVLQKIRESDKIIKLEKFVFEKIDFREFVVREIGQ